MAFTRTAISLVSATVCVFALAVQSAAQESEQPESTPQQASEQQARVRLFVSDKLVLNVYSGPAQGGERVATIETGDAVDELERADDSVRVRLDDGREGWVGANYLTSAAPAAVRLRELQREQKALAVDKKAAEELARLRKENAALASQVKQLEASAAQAAAAADVVEEDELSGTQDALEAQTGVASESTSAGASLWIALLAAILAGAFGFAAGYHTLAKRVREKFGGLKVYQ